MAEVDLLLKAFLNAGDDEDPPILDKVDVDFIPHPVSEFLQKVALGQELAKSGADWDEVITPPRIELSKAFLARSDARLEHVAAKIHKIFGDHELTGEAIEIVKSVFATERKAIIGA